MLRTYRHSVIIWPLSQFQLFKHRKWKKLPSEQQQCCLSWTENSTPPAYGWWHLQSACRRAFWEMESPPVLTVHIKKHLLDHYLNLNIGYLLILLVLYQYLKCTAVNIYSPTMHNFITPLVRPELRQLDSCCHAVKQCVRPANREERRP